MSTPTKRSTSWCTLVRNVHNDTSAGQRLRDHRQLAGVHFNVYNVTSAGLRLRDHRQLVGVHLCTQRSTYTMTPVLLPHSHSQQQFVTSI